MSHLPPNPLVWQLITPCLDVSDRAAVRCVSKDLAAAVDADAALAISAIRIAAWQPAVLHSPAHLQRSIKHLEADVSSAADWERMQQFIGELPHLHSIRFTGRRTWPPRLPDSSTTPSQHNQLQAASFSGLLTSLDQLAALAPSLTTLYCDKLVLLTKGVGNGTDSGCLPSCTRFGAEGVSVTARDAADAAQAFAAALPQLQVLYNLPNFILKAPLGARMRRQVLPVSDALNCCTKLQALRAFGTSTAMGGPLPPQLHGLQQLQRLSVYGVGPAVELRGLGKLTALTALSLAFELPDKRCGARLLKEVASLPQLAELALPAKLLCSRCCPGAAQALQQTLAGCCSDACNRATASSSSSTSSSSTYKTFPELKRLSLLWRPKAGDRRYQCGDHCKHLLLQDSEGLAAQLASEVTSARAANAGQHGLSRMHNAHLLMQPQSLQHRSVHALQQQERQSQQQQQLERQQLDVAIVELGGDPVVHCAAGRLNAASSDVWGMFAPALWCQ